MRHRDSEAHLFEHGKVEQLAGRVHTRMEGLVQSICGRLVGMGMCSAQCPCAEYQQVGMPWLEDEIAEALTKQRFGDDGMLDVRLVEDDFRRRWNKIRGLVQEPLNNKLLRSGKITDWGGRFLQSMRANSWLKHCSADDDVRLLKLTESWLRHLWDDASDNADMMTIRKDDFSEMWYIHPENVWLNDTKRRFGYRADRLYRRRISDADLREIDAILPESVRPSFASSGKVAESDEFFKVSQFCDALFAAVEVADAPVEKYQTAPNIQKSTISEAELVGKFEKFGVSMRVSNSGALEISSDDLDRLDDGIVDEMNPRALFDDFAAAWAMTRMNTHEQMTLLNQSVAGPSGTSQMTHGDRLVAPEEADDNDENAEETGEYEDLDTAN
jgi:hypothetical protein